METQENNTLDQAVLLAAADAAELEKPIEEPEAPKPKAAELMNDPEVKAYIAEQIKQGIQDALRGEVPKANPADNAKIEQAQFDRMTYKERLQLFRTDVHQYNRLAKGAI